MRRKIAMALLTAAFCAVSGMTAFAMPEQMPDGGVFDVEYYAEENPDVVAVMGNGKDALYQHYTLAGKNEGRLPGVAFDAEYYAANNPDVAAVLGTEEDILYQHYRLCGKSEGRLPSAPGTALKPLKSSAQTTPATPANPAEQPQAGGIQGAIGVDCTISTLGSKNDGTKEIYKMTAADIWFDGGMGDPRDSGRNGYGWHKVDWLMKQAEEDWNALYFWGVDVARMENETPLENETPVEEDESFTFTVTQDGVVYPECSLVGSLSETGYYCLYFILPKNYDGTILLKIYAAKLENGKPVKDEQNYIYYVLK